MTAHQLIQQKLQDRQVNGSLRQLRTGSGLIDFCSNDYLGFARSAELAEMIDVELANNKPVLNGSTGSRLLAGNTEYAENLEQHIANYHNAEAGLLFNSGYDANVGLLSSLPQRGDTVIHDELAHASIIDGIRLSHAKRYNFKHNDLESLAQKLNNAKGLCYVVVESVYSMDGDLAPLTHIAQICKLYNAALIVDEAHALGVFGKGLVNELGLEELVFARVATFGKALGTHGAIILGSKLLREYLINFARSFIYTTATPFHQLAAVKMGYQLLAHSPGSITLLTDNIHLYNKLLLSDNCPVNRSAIQTIMIGGNDKTKHIAINLQDAGFDIRPILSPTVPAGTERLRICLHSYNTAQEIENLAAVIKTFLL